LRVIVDIAIRRCHRRSTIRYRRARHRPASALLRTVGVGTYARGYLMATGNSGGLAHRTGRILCNSPSAGFANTVRSFKSCGACATIQYLLQTLPASRVPRVQGAGPLGHFEEILSICRRLGARPHSDSQGAGRGVRYVNEPGRSATGVPGS
jgi:hypothetical protein